MFHTRAIVKGRHPNHQFWSFTTDFGIPLTPHDKAAEHPKVKQEMEALRKRYPIVEVTFRDAA